MQEIRDSVGRIAERLGDKKAKQIFGLDEGKFVSLEDGVASMARWVNEVGARESGYFGNVEIEEKLPSIWAR